VVDEAGATHAPHRATDIDAVAVAGLLHEFNVEFGDPSPGVDVLARRLRRLLPTENTIAFLAGHPPVGLALLSLRANVWYDAPVALLDELYVEPSLRGRGIGSRLLQSCISLVRIRQIDLMETNVDGEDRDARRFYERHGFRCVQGHHTEPALYYSQEFL
jgi:GNAT superfamily N-acetyltransferase